MRLLTYTHRSCHCNLFGNGVTCSRCIETHIANYLEIIKMEAAGINRKLKELDSLEKRLKQQVNPSQILLKQIQEERAALLNPPQGELKK